MRNFLDIAVDRICGDGPGRGTASHLLIHNRLLNIAHALLGVFQTLVLFLIIDKAVLDILFARHARRTLGRARRHPTHHLQPSLFIFPDPLIFLGGIIHARCLLTGVITVKGEGVGALILRSARGRTALLGIGENRPDCNHRRQCCTGHQGQIPASGALLVIGSNGDCPCMTAGTMPLPDLATSILRVMYHLQSPDFRQQVQTLPPAYVEHYPPST